MAPRHIPRASLVNVKNHRPCRSCNSEHAAYVDNKANSVFEVPFYVAMRTPRNFKNMMQNSMDLKSGYTGRGVPHGSTGTVVYTLSQEESEMLYAMGVAGVDANGGDSAVVSDVGADDYILGDWMVGMLKA